MTLNLMVISRAAVFLSGDFRLTYDDGHYVDDLEAQKLIPVIKHRWRALVAWTGVARTPIGISTGEWIERETAAIPLDADVSSLGVTLMTAELWLARSRPRNLTMSIVGFARRRPFAMLVSNGCRIAGAKILPDVGVMSVSNTRPKEATVLALGSTSQLSHDDSGRLRTLIKANMLPEQFMEEVALVNANAAIRGDRISKECVVAWMGAGGGSALRPFNIPDGIAYWPQFVRRMEKRHGIHGYVPKYDANGMKLPPRWVGTTFVTENSPTGWPNFTAGISAMRNVGRPIGGPVQQGYNAAGWKVASNEPPFYRFSFDGPFRRKA